MQEMGASCCGKVQNEVDEWRNKIDETKIKQEWTNIYQHSPKLDIKTPIVVISDMHLGNGKAHEDVFLPVKENWLRAMQKYNEDKFTLVELGDIEDLWVYPFETIELAHRETFEMRQKFHDDERLIKIAGNHDDKWYRIDEVERCLGKWFKGIKIYESVILSNFFLLHGHQGSYEPLSFSSEVSACCLQTCWPTCLKCDSYTTPPTTPTTPSVNLQMYYVLDEIVDNWIKENKINTIIGHTHRPVVHEQSEEKAIRDVNDIKLKRNQYYFNTGSCINKDGSFTALEIYKNAWCFVIWRDGKRSILESRDMNEKC